MLRVTRRFDAPPQRVFDAWLDPAMAGRWLFATATRPVAHVEIDARVAGTFRFAEHHGPSPAVHTGRYLELAAPWRLAFSLILPGAPPAMTRVTVTLAARKSGCLLTLTHEDVPPATAPAVEARWTGILYGLGVMLDDDAPAAEGNRP